MRRPKFRFLPLLIVLIALAPFALARDNREYTQFGRDIRIAPGEKAADLTCFRCSIYVSGEVGGEVTTFGGNIVIEPGGSVSGDITSFLGDVRLSESTSLRGNLTTLGGRVRRQPGATVGGDTTTFEGQGWVWLILGVPVLLLGGIVALIVWLIQRRRRPSPAPARAA